MTDVISNVTNSDNEHVQSHTGTLQTSQTHCWRELRYPSPAVKLASSSGTPNWEPLAYMIQFVKLLHMTSLKACLLHCRPTGWRSG